MSVPTVVAVLTADSAVTALVSNRITPLTRAQSLTLPAITIQRVVMTPSMALTGDVGLDAHRIQLDCWAGSYHAVITLAASVRAAMGAAKHIFENEIDNYDPDTDPGTYRITQEYLVWV